MRILLEFKDVKRWPPLGKKGVLRGATFRVSAGEFVCVLGHPSSGIWTIPPLLFGLATATGGKIRILGSIGLDMEKKKKIAYVPKNFLPPPGITIREFFLLHAYLNRFSLPQSRLHSFLQEVHLYPHRHKLLEKLPASLLNLTYIAASLLPSPELVIYEDISEQVDENTAPLINDLLIEVVKHQGGVLLLSTGVGLIETLFHPYMYFFYKGKALGEGELADLNREEETLLVEVDGISEDLLHSDGVISVENLSDRCRLEILASSWSRLEKVILESGGIILSVDRQRFRIRDLLQV